MTALPFILAVFAAPAIVTLGMGIVSVFRRKRAEEYPADWFGCHEDKS